jgi:hypothetical protein
MRGTGAVAGVLAAAALAAVAVAPSGLAAPTSVPVLGSAAGFTGGKGFGTVKPKTVDLGGDPTGQFTKLKWTGWGSNKATGNGTGNYPPPGQPVSHAVKVPATLVVSQLGRCHGKTAYRHMAIFFTYKGHKKAGRSFNICP